MRSDIYPGLVGPRQIVHVFGVWLKMWRETVFEIGLDSSLDFPEGFEIVTCLNKLR